MQNKNTNNKHVSLNLNVRGIHQSPTLAINENSRKLVRQGKTIYKFGLGQSPFPVPLPVVESLKNHAFEKDYLPVLGLDELRKAVSFYHREKDNVHVSSNHILIGPGSKELMFILQLVFYGDILIPTPCWVSYVPQANIIGRIVHLIPTEYDNNWKITAEQLEAYLKKENDQFKPRLMVLNYPANPDGGTHSTEELKKIARIAKKHEMIILSDEIYGQLHFEGKHMSIARYYPEGTIISSGLSKWCGAGGWRLGTFAFPSNLEWLMNSMAAVASETYTSVSAPIQYAAVRAFKGGVTIERYLAHSRRVLKFIALKITKMLAEAGVKVNMPDGAFYLFLDFSVFKDKLKEKGVESSQALCDSLLNDCGVAILPGEAFQRPPEELTARLSYVNFDGAMALVLSETIPLSESLPDDFGEDCFNMVYKGIEGIVEWLKRK